MWLINVNDYTLHDVYDAASTHPYAILSHTWAEPTNDPRIAEITFQAIQSMNSLNKGEVIRLRSRSGWKKIVQTCKLAKQAGLQWAWVDTCCIDKSSSAEQTESINSMFRWYREARVCFVYLSDLPSEGHEQCSPDTFQNSLANCRWFSRGWTLQELIAPCNVEFYDEAWLKRGTKVSLEECIYSITAIDVGVLRDSEELADISVAKRMFWASSRQTKRLEDRAYSLFGIFDINLPLLYGEGSKAFLRLQDAIIRQTKDPSLFSWRSPQENSQVYHGLYALSPSDFSMSNNIVPAIDPLGEYRYSMTDVDRGLQLDAVINKSYSGFSHGTWNDADLFEAVMQLFCRDTSDPASDTMYAIEVARIPEGYARVNPHLIHKERIRDMHDCIRTSTYMPKLISSRTSRKLERKLQNAFQFRTMYPPNIRLTCNAVCWDAEDTLSPHHNKRMVSNNWDPATARFLTAGNANFVGLLTPIIRRIYGEDLWLTKNWRILCGFKNPPHYSKATSGDKSQSLEPWVCLLGDPEDDCFEEYDGHTNEGAYQPLANPMNHHESSTYASVACAVHNWLKFSDSEPDKLCKGAILFPPSDVDDAEESFEKAMQVTVEVESLEADGFIVHEAKVRLTPVEAMRREYSGKESAEGLSIPVFHSSREGTPY